MEKTLKFVRMAALLGAVGGSSVLLGLGSTAASAGEQRLHGDFSATYGLTPLIKGSGNDGMQSGTNTKTASSGMSRSKNDRANRDEPKIEDPPMPGFDGNSGFDGNGGSEIHS